MRLIGRIFGFLFALVIAAGVFVFFWIQDANRLKPELAALVGEQTDYEVSFDGDLAWQLLPPLSLHIRDVTALKDEQRITAADVQLKLDLSAIWQDIDRWRVTQLVVTDAVIEEDRERTAIDRLRLTDFRPGEPSELSMAFRLIDKTGVEGLSGTIDGPVTYIEATDASPQRIVLDNTRLDSNLLSGTCNANIADNLAAPAELPEPADDELLPRDTLLAWDFEATCAVDKLVAGTETFNDAKLDATNVNGKLNTALTINQFIGGTLEADASIDTRTQPVRWTILPDIKNVDSQRLLDWTSQNLQWIAPVALSSKVDLRGNTVAELAGSVRAESDFDGGQGQLNIAKIKAQLMRIALLTRREDKVTGWPDMWNYEKFTGNWKVEGLKNTLHFDLDNMSVDANGTYDYLQGTLDMLANVTIHESEVETPFTINPMLLGTPIPVRCRGAAEDPKCRVDEDASRKLIARALQRDDDSGLRKKIDQKIEEKVPDEYKDLARDLLDVLGRSLDSD